jgi:hypothetical protein
MQTTLTPDTQPRIGFAYDAIEVSSGKEKTHQVVYRGYQGGKHMVNNGKSTYYATRESKNDVEPVFRFDVTDIVH